MGAAGGQNFIWGGTGHPAPLAEQPLGPSDRAEIVRYVYSGPNLPLAYGWHENKNTKQSMNVQSNTTRPVMGSRFREPEPHLI